MPHSEMTQAREFNDPAPGVPFFTPHQTPVAGSAVNPQPSGKPIPTLFQPIKIRGLEFHNRIFVEYSLIIVITGETDDLGFITAIPFVPVFL